MDKSLEWWQAALLAAWLSTWITLIIKEIFFERWKK
jgi:hypothetical protein